MFGSHLSIAGGLVHSLEEAASLDLDCVQIFTKNQRQWKVKPLDSIAADAWLSTLRSMDWDGTNRVVSHNSYLINLASPDSTMRNKSIALHTEELERCERLHIPYCVAHPGARLGTPRKRTDLNQLGVPPTKEELAGLRRIVQSLDKIHQILKGYQVKTCLETTVGSGTHLGYDFQHLGWVKERVKDPERIQFCFDTCHVTAAGYDMSTLKKARAVLELFDQHAGIQDIAVFHFNDSVGEVGSRLDRHAHIGQGTCGSGCFQAILEHPSFCAVPKILETSKEENEKGELMDRVNLATLRRMANNAKKSR